MKTAMDLKWISPEVRNQKTVDAFGIAAAGVANLIADLAVHMPESELAPFRESAANMVQFLGCVLPLVTPEEEVKPQPKVMTEEEVKMNAVNAAQPPATSKPATPSAAPRVQTPSNVLDGILSGMGTTGTAAAKALGVAAPKPQALTATVGAAVPAFPDDPQAPQVLREVARVKAVSNKKTTAPNAQVPLPGDPENLKDAALVLEVLGEPAASEYEAASVLCEIWRKA